MNTDKFIERLRDWQNRVDAFQKALSLDAKSLAKQHYAVGLPATVLSAVAATTTFAQLGSNPDVRVQVGLGAISLLSAVLAGLMTFYSFIERSEHSRSIAAQLGNIRREIDIWLAFPPKSDDDMIKTLRALNEQIGRVSSDAPTIIVSQPSDTPSQSGKPGGGSGGSSSGGGASMIVLTTPPSIR